MIKAEESEVQAEQKEPAPKVTTLGEWGHRLPCGMVDSVTGKLVKDISFRSWNLGREKQLGKIKTSSAADSVMTFTSAVLTVMCTKLGTLEPRWLESGGLGLKPQQFAQLRLQTSNLVLEDVLYTYLLLRRETIGPDLKVDGNCPYCRQEAHISADLDTTTVKYVDDIAETFWTYDLKDSLKIRGEEITELKFGPARWSVLEHTKASGVDTGGQKADLILGSIEEVGQLGKIALIETELDEMSKRDVEGIAAEMDQRAIGPDMRVEFTCEKCFRVGRLQIDWNYDSFFGYGRSER
jgi:hypothetical protein